MTRTQRMALLTRDYDTITYGLSLLWFAGWTLLALKLAGMVDVSWWLVPTPFWAPYAAAGIYRLCYGRQLTAS